MSEYPPDFNYKSLVTENDIILEKLILEKYSEEASLYAAEEHLFTIAKKNFSEYMDKVKKKLKKNLAEQNFIEEIQQLNFDQNLPRL